MRKANPNSAWSRMKRKAYDQGKREGYYEAFDKWYEGRVTFLEKAQHVTTKGYRSAIEEAMFAPAAADSIGGIRYKID